MSGKGINNPTPLRVFTCVFSYAIGLLLMIGSDVQKNLTLKFQKGLITTGYNQRTRNPNYLGEILIYSSFAAATGHIISYSIVLFAFVVLFQSNMMAKEISLAKKDGWNLY